MASLVAPLACGVSGAASGSAAFYRTATSTLATVYSDAEGVTAVTSHLLDSNGGISRYVEERVDVVVADANGATVRTFTWGTDARDARVENVWFTGPDATGAVVAGGRQTADGAFTKLGASLGATDGNVLINGTAYTLTDALSNSARVFNVKKYGAAGDGVADDGPKVQLAWNAAANAGGGIVYYPSGTYLHTTAAVMPASVGKVTHLGESASGTTIKQANTTTCWTLGNGNNNTVMGLTFAPSSSANTGTLIAVGSTSRITFISCVFSALNGTAFALTAASTSRVSCHSCAISQAGASSRIASGSGSYFRLEGCEVDTAGGDLTSFSDQVYVISLATNWAMGSAISAGTTYIHNNNAGTAFEIIGGELNVAFTSGTVTVGNTASLGTEMKLTLSAVRIISAGATLTLASALTELYESGCFFSGTGLLSAAWPPSPVSIGTPVRGYSTSRQRAYVFTALGATNNYTPTVAYHLHEITSTAAAMTINAPSTTMPTAWPLVIVYKNLNVAAVTPAFDAASYFLMEAAPAIAQNKSGVFVFCPRFGLTTNTLVCISPQVATGVTLP